ncbi:hypothetical protein TNCV_2519521 [Trichonephila clavipes]|nr:hypothetical protein TNCV_2519521 [Trichonephila clavipes]
MDVLRHAPTGPGLRGASFRSRLCLDLDRNNFNGQILFPFIFSEKQGISNCMSTGKSGKTILLYDDHFFMSRPRPSGVTENIRAPLQSQVLGPDKGFGLLQRVSTWHQSGFGLSKTLSPRNAGGIRYATA